MGFSDKLAVADGITITLNCGMCNTPATEGHVCVKRYLRNPKVVLVKQLSDDSYLVKTLSGDEEYMTTRAVLIRDYEEI